MILHPPRSTLFPYTDALPIYNKKKLVSLCYFLASINNKYINGIKADIGSYLETSGASATSIDTIANLGLSVSRDRKSTRLNSSHSQISYAVFCLKKKNKKINT